MAGLRVHNFAVSLDGFGAGLEQSVEAPLGVGAEALHEWVFKTRTGRAMIGQEGGTTGIDDHFLRAGEDGIGATIMGRNMFGPVRGPWPDESWRGWWSEEPPYHHPVYVMTHFPRPDLPMDGETVFHFVQGPPGEVLAMAVEAAGGRDVRLGGGVSTVRAFLAEGLVDELHIAIAPVFLGVGERLFGDGVPPVGYACDPIVAGEGAAHAVIRRA
ncbi:dihydrofolate reductase family protein [Sinomonas notoginsengisoli]|uniref:dihydrofolate reductase family protein n=1 Tax=Sinomonas notoginsengisoli TaxID=1457311 RepID=UPI001F3A9979|nr:dihydrofolate reductase family protein [Sinomonas notoginsengisoli]